MLNRDSRLCVRIGSAIATCLLSLVVAIPLTAQDEDDTKGKSPQREAAPAMDNDRLGELLEKRFKNIEGRPGFWLIKLEEQVEEPEPDDAEAPESPDDTDEPQEAGEAKAEEVILMVVTDERANRMRIMTPIRKYDTENEEDAKLAVLLLHANFDRALDAKYAINSGVLWSCFVHPLASLSEGDLDNALTQVQTLRKNTGTSYSSTDMIFGGGQPPEEEEQPRRPEI